MVVQQQIDAKELVSRGLNLRKGRSVTNRFFTCGFVYVPLFEPIMKMAISDQILQKSRQDLPEKDSLNIHGSNETTFTAINAR
jgi:hypothetical protein